MTLSPQISSFYSPKGLKAVAEAIDRYLDGGGVSQNELAKLVGAAPSTLTAIRRNRGNSDDIAYAPEPEMLFRIARGIGEDPEELLLLARGFSPAEYVSKFTRTIPDPPEKQIIKGFKRLDARSRLNIAGEILRILSEDFSSFSTDVVFSQPEVFVLCEALLEEFLRVLAAEEIELSTEDGFRKFCDRLKIDPVEALAARLRELALFQTLSSSTEKTDIAALRLAIEQITGHPLDLDRFRMPRTDCGCDCIQSSESN